MKKSNKIVYLIAYEKPSDNPLLKTQVYDFLKTIKKINESFEITIVFVVSFVSFIKNYFNISKVRSDLINSGLNVNFIYDRKWIRSIYMVPNQVIAMRKRIVPKINKLLCKINPDVIHCRSYLAQDLAIACRMKNTVFDPRSSYVDECIYIGLFKQDSKSNQWWLKRENELLKEAKSITAVSEPFVKEIEIRSKRNAIFIPITCDAVKFQRNSEIRNKARKELGLVDCFTFIFVGQIGKWHQLNFIIDTYKELSRLCKFKTKLLIVGSDKTTNGISDVVMIPKVDHSFISYYYQASDAGLMIYPKTSSNSKIILSTKFTEYCAAGLVPIVNKECGGAVEIIERYNCGCVIDSENRENYKDTVQKLNNQYSILSSNAKKVAHELFDLPVVSQKYINLY